MSFYSSWDFSKKSIDLVQLISNFQRILYNKILNEQISVVLTKINFVIVWFGVCVPWSECHYINKYLLSSLDYHSNGVNVLSNRRTKWKENIKKEMVIHRFFCVCIYERLKSSREFNLVYIVKFPRNQWFDIVFVLIFSGPSLS